MNLVVEILHETWSVVAEAAPWLFVGFLCAGLLKAFVPGRLIARQLGGDDLRSVLLASLYGAPIPLCSCSVIPTASALRTAGASKGATSSFLISTPETGVDSISVTYALLDPWMTVFRPLAAFASAVVTGSTVNVLVRRGVVDPRPELEATPEEPAHDDCCDPAHDEAEHHHGHSHSDELGVGASATSAAGRARAGIRYAFVDLLDDLTPVLWIGLLLSGAIAALVPEGFFSDVVPTGIVAMLLMLLVGTPLYVCATASTPIAAALIAKGLDPGAALVFLLVGPATNVTTLLVVGRLLGRAVLLAYLAGVVGVALAAGFGANLLYERLQIDLAAIVAQEPHAEPGWVAQAAGTALTLLLVWSAIRIRFDRILLGWLQAPMVWIRSRKQRRSLSCVLLAGALGALVATGASCRTTTQESSTNSGARTVVRAAPTQAWDVVLDGEHFGRVVRFDVDGRPSETRFIVQNPYGQDLGLVDAVGRAYRYRPHAEAVWVGTGTVVEGIANVLDLTGRPTLKEVAFDAPREAGAKAEDRE